MHYSKTSFHKFLYFCIVNDMNGNIAYGHPSAVDVADTGQWHLVIGIRHDGMQAWLKSKADPTRLPVKTLDVGWKDSSKTLLENIEATVYDHPALLDDFSTDIVLDTPQCLWVPSQMLEDNDDEEFFKPFYDMTLSDIFTTDYGESICLFSLTRGLKSFLARTFSGSRINCHLGVLFSHFRTRSIEHPHIYVIVRTECCDIIGIESEKIIFSSSRRDLSPTGILYHIVNATAAYGLNNDNVRICTAGEPKIKVELSTLLRKYFKHVLPANVPSAARIGEMPLELALCTLKSETTVI